MAEKAYDVAVIGGGMVGAALACALAQRGFSTLLLEAREPQLSWDPEGHDLRVSAITRASQQMLYGGHMPSLARWAHLTVVAVASLALGSWIFGRLSPRFAEEV